MIALLGNRYRVVREIGAGGMGRVFQAVDTQTSMAVAAKVMIAGSDEGLDTLLRFSQEGAVLSTLKHPNIVQVYGTFLEEGTCSIIMELLDGQSLADLLKHERLTLRRIKLLGTQVAEGLGYAHWRGIVHRDVKPGNIMVVGDHVKVTDFGIARVARRGTFLTASGVSLGTPLFMSPEQVEGGRVDARSDIYSLGAVLYQMVAGRPPFEGTDPISIAFQHVHKAPTPPSNVDPAVPPDWDQLILQMLAKDPAERPQTAKEVAEAISMLNEAEVVDTPAPREVVFGAGPPLSESEIVGLPPHAVHDPMVTVPALSVEQVQISPPGPVPESESSAVEDRPRSVPAVKARTRRSVFISGAAAVVLIVIGLLAYTVHGAGSHGISFTFALQAGPYDDPEGVTVDGHGNIYVAARGENKIVKLSPQGKLIAAWGGKGSGRGQFNGPTGVALDSAGNVFVADSGNNRIVELSPRGRWIANFGGGPPGTQRGQFAGVHGIAVDAQGNIFVTDYGNNRIVELTPGEFVTGVFGGPRPGSGSRGLNQPVGLAVDSSSHVYVADFYNRRIVKLTSEGQLRYLTQFLQFGIARGLVRPHGVAVDSKGNIYVADYQRNTIEELSPAGAPLGHWGTAGSRHGQFLRPTDVWVDSHGSVYVTDSGNNRIQKFAPAG